MSSTSADNMEKEIRKIVSSILEIDEDKIGPNTRFVEDLGMDSMMALEILASVEKKYKIRVPEEYLTRVTSLKSILEIAKKIIENK